MKTASILAILTLLIAGCAAVSTPMRHRDGRTFNCSAWGELTGAAIELKRCVGDMRALGFVLNDEPLPEIETPTWTPPPGWEQAPIPATLKNTFLYGRNETYNSELGVSRVPRIESTEEWAEKSSERSRKMWAEIDKDATISEKKEVTVKGYKAYTYTQELITTRQHFFFVERPQDSRSLATFIRTRWLIIISTPKGFQENIEPQIESILESLPI